MGHSFSAVLISLAVIVLTGCQHSTIQTESKVSNTQHAQPTLLSYGMIKKKMSVGSSTQGEAIKLFGSPSNMTYQANGSELWIYDRVTSESYTNSSSSSTGGGIGVIAAPVGAVVGGSSKASSTRSISQIRVLTVIMEFNNKGILIDLTARQGGY